MTLANRHWLFLPQIHRSWCKTLAESPRKAASSSSLPNGKNMPAVWNFHQNSSLCHSRWLIPPCPKTATVCISKQNWLRFSKQHSCGSNICDKESLGETDVTSKHLEVSLSFLWSSLTYCIANYWNWDLFLLLERCVWFLTDSKQTVLVPTDP